MYEAYYTSFDPSQDLGCANPSKHLLSLIGASGKELRTDLRDKYLVRSVGVILPWIKYRIIDPYYG